MKPILRKKGLYNRLLYGTTTGEITQALSQISLKELFNIVNLYDCHSTLPDCLLRRVDVIPLKFGIEARSPFCGLIVSNTVKNNIQLARSVVESKVTFRQYLRQKKALPEKVINTKKKGFEPGIINLVSKNLNEVLETTRDYGVDHPKESKSLTKAKALAIWNTYQLVNWIKSNKLAITEI